MIANAANALTELFNLTQRSLSTEKLEWFAGLEESAKIDATNIATTLSALAMMHGSRDQASLPSTDQLVNILFGLASQAEIVSAMIEISSDARQLLSEKNSELTGNKKP